MTQEMMTTQPKASFELSPGKSDIGSMPLVSHSGPTKISYDPALAATRDESLAKLPIGGSPNGGKQ